MLLIKTTMRLLQIKTTATTEIFVRKNKNNNKVNSKKTTYGAIERMVLV